MFDNLSDRLERSFKILKGEGKITEVNVAETIKEIRRALLDADVSYKVAKDFCDKVKTKAMGANVLTAVKPQQMMVKIVHDELAEFMGAEHSEINLKGSPAVILVAGLNGSGKTTFCGKLALRLKSKKGVKVLLAACDTFRPAAITQLQTLGEQVGVPVYSEEGEKDPVKVAKDAVAKARQEGCSVVIVDTAGRLVVDKELMDEISTIHKALGPSETLFVVDAMTGQDAVESAKAFNEAIDYDGVVLSKMDGDTRGGAALSARAITGKPIKFVGTGEKLDDLDVFHPDRMASRILGMGDMLSLIEKAEQQFDEEQALELERKLRKNKFDLNDLLSNLQQVRKLGPMQDLLGMIPGIGNKAKDIEVDEKQFDRLQALIQSMTPKERENPDIINPSRKRRIAAGAGQQVEDVNRLLSQYRQMQKMFKQMNSKKSRKAMKRMSQNMNPSDLNGLDFSKLGL